MAKKKKVNVGPSGSGKRRKSWRKQEHDREPPYDGSVDKSKITWINQHERNARRTEDEIKEVVKRFKKTGKLPLKRIVKYRKDGSQYTIENPWYIADMRILQRRGLIPSKIPRNIGY